jgi:hypothetical protein
MLFGRLRSPYQRLAAEVRDTRPQPLARRGHSARQLLSLVVLPLRVDGILDDYADLDRLDREELDE